MLLLIYSKYSKDLYTPSTLLFQHNTGPKGRISFPLNSLLLGFCILLQNGTRRTCKGRKSGREEEKGDPTVCPATGCRQDAERGIKMLEDDQEFLREVEEEKERKKRSFKQGINKGKLSSFEMDELFLE